MSLSGEPPAGRRGNGLAAADWGALVDLDPRLSATMLDSLAVAGVAAFVEPARGIDTVSRAVALPHRPLDRLWVDPAHADEARAVVGAEIADLAELLARDEPDSSVAAFVRAVPRSAATRVLAPPALPVAGRRAAEEPPPVLPAAEPDPAAPGPLPGPIDDDEAWRQIVAGWDSPAAPDPVPRWPVTEDAEAPARQDRPRRRRTDGTEPDDDVEALPAWLEPEALEDDGHYEPPAPPPVPRLHRYTVGAVVCLLLGLVLVFAPNLLGQPATVGLGLVGIVLMVGGAGALVWRMRDAPPHDSGPDDGAVV